MDEHQPPLSRGFHVKTNIFEGPISLLLHLIEERKLPINDVSLAQVTDDYISYIRSESALSYGDTTQFLVIAATLVLIKSKSLLPNLDLSVEEEASIEDLEKRLVLYRLFQKYAKNIALSVEKQSIFFPEKQRPVPVFAPGNNLTATVLSGALVGVISAFPKTLVAPAGQVVASVIKIEQILEDLMSRVEQAISFSFRDYASHGAGKIGGDARQARAHMVVSFLALLELVKKGMLSAHQKDSFDDIMVERI